MNTIFVFDIFGTLVDLSSLEKIIINQFNIFKEDKFDNLKIKLFLEAWQSKQLQYSWLLILLNQYGSFSNLSLKVLKQTAKIFDIPLNENLILKLNEAKTDVKPFPDSKIGIEILKIKTQKNTIYYFK
jgi:FMN phosphatase YigB (HAD superfamily)